jgi:hypothetical protein
MRVKPVNDPAYAMVFVDRLAFGPIFTMKRISTTQVDRIKFLNARDATTKAPVSCATRPAGLEPATYGLEELGGPLSRPPKDGQAG